MYYQVYGMAQKPKLLFLHGFMGNGDDFATVAQSLSTQYCCLLVDLPGHGQTVTRFPTQDYGIEATAASLFNLLRSLEFSPCHVMGYSMGGRLALYWALRYPEACLSLLLESASPGLAIATERQQRQQQDEQVAQELETGDWPHFLRQWYNQPLFEPLRQSPAFEALLQRRQLNNPLALAQVLRQMGTGTQPSLWAQLPTLTQSITLIVGAADQKFVQLNQRMAAQCPTAHLQIIEGCGHGVHLENPQAFIGAVQSHLRSCPSPV